MTNLSLGIEREAYKKGIKQAVKEKFKEIRQKGYDPELLAMVETLKGLLPSFDDLHDTVTQNRIYSKVTKEELYRYYQGICKGGDDTNGCMG